MKNSFNIYFLNLIFCLIFIFNVNAEDQINLDVTEMIITEGGNRVKGYNNGKATTNDGIIITAETFDYNKITNILDAKGDVEIFDTNKDLRIYADKIIYFKDKEKIFSYGDSKAIDDGIILESDNFEYFKKLDILNANGDVKINDTIKNHILFSEDVTYLRNLEKIFSKGKTEVRIDSKYTFYSKDVTLLRNVSELNSKNKSLIIDGINNIYELDEFKYYANKKLLKGKNVTITSKVKSKTNPTKFENDKYNFSEGFFDFKDKSFVSKDTKIKIHKSEFENPENDPRLSGASSRGDASKTIINKGSFTICKITDTCPPWRVDAEKITHDKEKKELIYKNAILKLYDIPVMYFPKFFHPDPTVKRKSGFLHPQFNNSTQLGVSVQIPYFKVISDSQDYTFKPTYFENDKYILQNEYRQETKKSSLITDFSLTKGYKSSHDQKRNSIGHLFLRYKYDLQFEDFNNSNLSVNLEKVTQDTYLKVFQNNLFWTPAMPTNNNVMSSGISLDLDHEDFLFSSSINIYEDLGLRSSDRYQYILPSYNFSKSYLLNKLNGSLNFNSYGSNNLTQTDRLVSSVINDVNYNSIDYISDFGSKFNYGIYLKNSNYIRKNDPNYKSSPKLDVANLLEVSASMPLSKTSKNLYEVITPRISLRANPINNMKDNSGSSNQVSAGNVFNINRLGLSDTFEAGKSITLGLDYRIELPSKIKNVQSDDFLENNFNEQIQKSLEFKLATVFRDEEENFISSTSTINRTNSNLFGSVISNLSENLSLTYDFSLDNDMGSFDSNSINAIFSINNFVTTFNFTEQNAELGESNVITNETEYKIDNNNYLVFNTRRNREIDLTEYYNLSYEYKTDCLTAALKYNKTFYEDRDLKPNEDLFFTLTIIPLTTYEKKLYNK
jgi:LPS-assembly protein